MAALSGATQEEGHTGVLHLPSAMFALIFSREGFSHPIPSSIMKSKFVYPRIDRCPLVGHYCFILFCLARKNPGTCECTEI